MEALSEAQIWSSFVNCTKGEATRLNVCADLACSLYVQDKRQPKLRSGRYGESLSQEERIARTLGNLDAFVARVTQDEDDSSRTRRNQARLGYS